MGEVLDARPGVSKATYRLAEKRSAVRSRFGLCQVPGRKGSHRLQEFYNKISRRSRGMVLLSI